LTPLGVGKQGEREEEERERERERETKAQITTLLFKQSYGHGMN
jgi:hypothetical protein